MTKSNNAVLVAILVSTMLGFVPLRGLASTIHDVAVAGDIQRIKDAIASGADVNEKDTRGITPLLLAVFGRHTEVAKYLVEKGAKVSEKGPGGMTALGLACNKQLSKEFISYLLDKGADPNAKDATGRTALLFVAGYGNLDTVRLLVEKGADVNLNAGGTTPLIIATVLGHAEIVQFLIEKGADANAKDSGFHQATPLMSAAGEGFLDIVKILLQGKAVLDDKDDNGITALMYAARQGRSDVVEYLLGKGANPNTRDNTGTTALMLAAKEYAGTRGSITPDVRQSRRIQLDHIKAVAILLEKGADPKIKDNKGKTALMLVQDSISKRSEQTSLGIEEVKRLFFKDIVDVLTEPQAKK